MEYYGLTWNRSFLIYVAKDELYGIKFCGLVTSNAPGYFVPALQLLDDPWFTPGTEAFRKSMKESRANFFVPQLQSSMPSSIAVPNGEWGEFRIPAS